MKCGEVRLFLGRTEIPTLGSRDSVPFIERSQASPNGNATDSVLNDSLGSDQAELRTAGPRVKAYTQFS